MARCLLLAVLLGAVSVLAVREGDEVYGVTRPAGYFYVFADKAIHVVSALNLKVLKNITTDQSGARLTNAGSVGATGNDTTRGWNDATYLEDASHAYVFVNEADIYQNPDGTEYSYVTVIDTRPQEIVGRIKVGALPVHGYSIIQQREYWAHSDVAGSFYVISLDNVNATKAPVAGFKTNTGHGKLLVDDSLYPVAYSTNVNEQVIQQINLATQTRTNSYNYSSFLPDPTICTGTHSIGYSNISRHIYVECADNNGVIEWDTVRNAFVAFFSNQTGYVSVAPGDDKVLVVGYDNIVNVLAPTSNGKPAVAQYSIVVPGGADVNPVYWSAATTPTPGVAQEYVVFFALTADTNINSLRAAAASGVQYPNTTYHNAPTDCAYVNRTAAAADNSNAGLQLATNSSGQPLTPQCGACAPGIADGNPDYFNTSLSGLRYVNLTAVEAAAAAGTDAEAALIPAGGVQPTKNTDTGANACSFGEANRKAKRGGRWVATVADLPSPALYVIDGASQTVHGTVDTADGPTSLAWVPIQTGAVSAASKP